MEDLAKLYKGEQIAGISAVLLFCFMFLSWFGVEVSGPDGSVSFGSIEGGSAWDLDFISWVLLLSVVLTLANLSLRVSNFDYEPPVSPNVVLASLGAVCSLLIVYRIVDPPSFGEINGVSFDGTLKYGIFLGLIAAVCIAFGSYRALREERASLGTGSVGREIL